LCNSRQGRPVAVVSTSAIWDRLEQTTRQAFDESFRGRYTEASEVVLWACSTCGLEHFSPRTTADGAFYARLASGEGYYDDDTKWEFGLAGRLIDPTIDVLDVGCGEGAFLRSAGRDAHRAVGVDANPEAVGRLRAAGTEAYAVDIGAFADEHQSCFDVVCAFQVLEHVPDPVAMAAAATRCLRPGGRLVVSVPNRERLRLGGLDPLDHPPHHVTRWSMTQLDELIARLDLELVDHWFQRRSPAMVVTAAPKALARRWRRRAGPTDSPSPAIARAEPPVAGIGELPTTPAPPRRPRDLVRWLRNDHSMAIVARRPST
jgi:2-polyprenyl-3-methyl-5-hydroxy-6-metoxy-1,4-benzoquinol methylase